MFLWLYSTECVSLSHLTKIIEEQNTKSNATNDSHWSNDLYL